MKKTEEQRITDLENRLIEVQRQMENVIKLLDHQEAVNSEGLEKATTKTLMGIGVQANLLGFKYLKDACVMATENPEILRQITKGLYTDIAKKYKTKATRVERAIRHAIETAVDRCEPATLYEYFGESISPQKGKPTNSLFISNIAERLRLEGY
ncbi:MAG: sporulation initiation factor Spo0A C-terminal domain-containing protein [Clostridia bacterium]|nr:sporulation initiation factor Spo0A C-terminal domain-containing protein [Clostridia bacterium]